MTTDRYAALRAALAAGPTPGPWSARVGTRVLGCDARRQRYIHAKDVTIAAILDGEKAANAALIAAADPETIAALLAEWDALREATEGLLNALPSATTHPAISAARAALAAQERP